MLTLAPILVSTPHTYRPYCMLRSCTAPLPKTWQYQSCPTLCCALQKLDLSNNHLHGKIDALLSQTELLSDFSISNNKWGLPAVCLCCAAMSHVLATSALTHLLPAPASLALSPTAFTLTP